MLSVDAIDQKVQRLRQKYALRDQRMQDLLAVRQGNADQVFPGMFPDAWPKPVVANFVDVVARDLAEVIAPMPSVNCAVTNMVSEKAKKFAARKTRIANFYLQHSEVPTQMFTGADRYLSYGFVAFYVEPDFDAMVPRIKVEDSVGGYPEWDRWDRLVSYTKRSLMTVDDLCSQYPEYEHALRGNVYDQAKGGQALLDLVRYCDGDQITLYVPQRNNLVLLNIDNALGKCPVVVAKRPGLDDEMRGQFDDVLWVQMARAKMAMLSLEATEKAVQAPLALPADVQEMTFGPDAVLRTSSPEKIRRVGLELPNASFAEAQNLDSEMRVGARYPEARSGQPGASIITGRGVQELMGGFDTQVKTAQEVLGHALKMTLRMCFEMDQKLWPNTTKTIRGTANGSPFEETYKAVRDIAGDFTVDVTYGFAAGMDPNRALVFLLQLRGDKLIDRDTVQRQLPWDVDVVKLAERIDIEETVDALKQGLFAYAQAIPAMAQQGLDPSHAIQQIAGVISARQKGTEFHEAVLKAFAPPPPQPAEESPEMGTDQAGPPGAAPSSLPEGVAPGQAGLPPGGRPDLQMLMANLSATGKPVLGAGINRRLPIVQ